MAFFCKQNLVGSVAVCFAGSLFILVSESGSPFERNLNENIYFLVLFLACWHFASVSPNFESMEMSVTKNVNDHNRITSIYTFAPRKLLCLYIYTAAAAVVVVVVVDYFFCMANIHETFSIVGSVSFPLCHLLCWMNENVVFR